MDGVVSAIQLSFVLLGFLAVAIGLPAVLFGVIHYWQVIFLLLGYAVFFMATIWRVWKYGKLRKLSEDEQLKRLDGVGSLAAAFVGILALHWLAVYDFSRYRIAAVAGDNPLVDLLGICLIAAAIIINQLAIGTLKGLFNRIAIESNHQLILSGIYKIVRHPIYLSYFLLFAGFCILLHSNFITFGVMVLTCTVWLGNRIAIEEEMLLAKFGQEYKAYQQKTKKLFPFIY